MTSKILIDRDALLAAANRLSDRGQAQVAAPLWEALAAPEAPRQSRVATGQWRIPVNGDWFYGTKAACERERAEYESTFTDLDREEAGVVLPEQIYTAPLSPELIHDRAYRNGLMAGFQFGISGNEKGYATSLKNFNAEILAAKTGPLSPDHSGGGAGVLVLPSDKEIQSIKTKAARQADLTSGANYFTADEFAADTMLDKVKELNQ